jgi:hypothetical protein
MSAEASRIKGGGAAAGLALATVSLHRELREHLELGEEG